MHTPIFPGAMNPEQLIRRAITQAAAIAATIAILATFTTIFIMFS